jgi:S-adenosylmethionine hydrolase
VILKVDKFGNLITNLTEADVPQLFASAAQGFKIVVGNKDVTTLRTAYAQGMHNEVFAIVGSMGYLELAANRGAASQLLGATRGNEVIVHLNAGASAGQAAPAS